MTFKIRKRLSSTKLKMLEASKWAAGNSSVLMQKVAQTVDITVTTSAASLSTRNVAIDVAQHIHVSGRFQAKAC